MDGSYLAELLLEKGHEVYGLLRRCSNRNTQRIEHLLDYIKLVSGDVTDQSSLDGAMEEVKPDLIFHLAAQSHVQVSWQQPELTGNVTGLGTLRMLEAMRKYAPDAKFYNAASSEMFGKVQETPQKETTPFYPRSPYGCAKVFGFNVTRNYRESFDLFACSGICFNHEGTRRAETFVTKKIAMGVARIKHGLQSHLELGNLEAQRDWSHAKDVVAGMALMLEQSMPDDFILASGETHSIREFLDIAFQIVGIKDWAPFVKFNPAFMRPAEVDVLLGDPSKAHRVLGWKREYSFTDVVSDMTTYELAKLL